MAKSKIIAHRGDSARHPENSWTAIAAALTAGADICEVDLQRCANGVIVCRHDYFLDGRLLADLSSTEARNRIPDIPVLDELVDWAEKNVFPLLLEVKDVAVMDALTRILRGHSPELFTVGSYHGPFLREFERLRPEFPTSLMIGTVLDVQDSLTLARRYNCDGVHPCWESRAPYPHQLLTPEAVKELGSGGLLVTLWHEERENELQALLALAPDAICTNTPARLKQLRDDYE